MLIYVARSLTSRFTVEMFKVRMQGQYGSASDKRLRAVVREMWKEWGFTNGIMRGYWVSFSLFKLAGFPFVGHHVEPYWHVHFIHVKFKRHGISPGRRLRGCRCQTVVSDWDVPLGYCCTRNSCICWVGNMFSIISGKNVTHVLRFYAGERRSPIASPNDDIHDLSPNQYLYTLLISVYTTRSI